MLAFPPKPAWRRWAPLAAAGVVIVAGGVVMERQITPAPPAEVPSPMPVFAPHEMAFALALGTSRAAAEQTVLSIPPRLTTMQLRVHLNPADRFDTYAADLRASSTDAQVWRAEGLRATIDNGELVVAARIPAAEVPDGAYELAVRGVRAGGAASDGEALGIVALKVVRLP